MRRPNQDIQAEGATAAWDAVRAAEGTDSGVTASCNLITPMFGGGVTPGEVDRAMPIRASALRGQLRFWWRLLQDAGRESENSADLFQDECALWGAISSNGPQASRVRVQIVGDQVGEPQLVQARESDSGFPPYALILDRKDNPWLIRQGYSFELVLRFNERVTPTQREEVVEALRWWASFGGVGARTRRGLGAVKAVGDHTELKPVTAEEVKAKGGWMIVGKTAINAVKAWKDSVGALQRFRQGPGVGRNQGQHNRPGRSRWPEADTIRRTAKTHAPMHQPKHKVDGFYPRAAFGLPLVFHFKDKNQGDPRGKDSDSLELNPKGQDRMASPLILRPYFDGQRCRPMALLLPGWEERISTVVNFNSQQVAPAWPEDPRTRKQLAENVEPMKGRGTDALSAFMRYFQETLESETG